MARGLPILFLLLISAVAAREIPELYDLADDPSNDGMIFNWQSQAPVCTPRRLLNNERVGRPLAFRFAGPENPACTSVVPTKTGQDILRLVSLLRT